MEALAECCLGKCYLYSIVKCRSRENFRFVLQTCIFHRVQYISIPPRGVAKRSLLLRRNSKLLIFFLFLQQLYDINLHIRTEATKVGHKRSIELLASPQASSPAKRPHIQVYRWSLHEQ